MKTAHNPNSENGNVLIFVLLGVVLLGILTVALRGSDNSGTNLTHEKLSLSINRVMAYVNNVERGMNTLLNDRQLSETELFFAHTKAHADYGTITIGNEASQLFDYNGGNVVYQEPPRGINDGTNWEFIGGTAAPGVGSANADLLMVLPNVSVEFCGLINEYIGYPRGSDIPVDSGACLYETTGRYDTGSQFASSANSVPATDFRLPALKACVACESTKQFHFYAVLHGR